MVSVSAWGQYMIINIAASKVSKCQRKKKELLISALQIQFKLPDFMNLSYLIMIRITCYQ